MSSRGRGELGSSAARGQRKTGGVGGGGSGRLWGMSRCQTGDEEEFVGLSAGRRPPTGVGVGVATNCYDARNKRRHKRR